MKRPPFPWPQADASEKQYWRSLDQLADTPEFQEYVQREFPQGASELSTPVSRRSFMSLMGASLALSGLAACRRPEEKILPFSRAPENSVIGLPSYYATTITLGQEAIGVLCESNDGRPTKLEGNPAHPASLGASNAFIQASILELYDPDRSTHPVLGGKAFEGANRAHGLEQAEAKIKARAAELRGRGGEGLTVLSGALISPTLLRLREELLAAMPKAQWLVWEAINDDSARGGSRLAFGEDLFPRLQLDRADIILALDADPLGLDPDALRHAKDFAARRRPEDGDDTMNRLYVVEPSFTITGASADHRLRMRASEVGAFVVQLAAAMQRAGLALPTGLGEALPQPKSLIHERFVGAVARDLVRNKGKAVITVGRRQSKEVHALVQALNGALGAVGKTLTYVRQLDSMRTLCGDAIRDVSKALTDGKVDTLVVLGGNPAYDAPADTAMAETLGKAQMVVHLGLYFDETAKAAHVHLPRTHFLESWGDAHATDGTVSVVQPLIAPLHDGWSDIELIALLSGGERQRGYELVRQTWRKAHTPPAEATNPGQAPAKPEAGGAQPGVTAASSGPGQARAEAKVTGEVTGQTGAALPKTSPITAAATAGKAVAVGAAAAATVTEGAKATSEAGKTASAKPEVGAARPEAASAAAGGGKVGTSAIPGTAATAAVPPNQVQGPGALELIFDSSWRKVLHDGLQAGSAPPPVTPELRVPLVIESITGITGGGGDGFDVVFTPSSSVYDGRFANNGWLQEFPDPITKLTWDNAALLSPKTAKELSVGNDDLVRISFAGRTIEAAVFVQPGQADHTVTMALGYGRKTTGRIGQGAGFNVYPLRDSRALGFVSGATVAKTGSKYDDPRDMVGFDIDNARDGTWLDLVRITGLTSTQDHFSQSIDEKWNQNRTYSAPGGPKSDPEAEAPKSKPKGDGHSLASTANHHAVEGRPLARETTLEEFRKDPAFAQKAVTHPPLKSLWEERPYVGQQWGMAIDLSACVGCGACTVACQAENNIPIVGKAQVRKGREMHWIRVDRYFSGSIDDPESIHQPVPCMQCENAPCENVCPVAATVHSTDGLNDMVYNRCVGTRYCSNNCPYKVRRFNFLDWRHYYERDADDNVLPVARLKYNPDVTLRSRGIMEKCTYCVQRIRGAQRDASSRGQERVGDGVIEPACAQACPSDAIVFGDITDEKSRVSLVKKSQRNYSMLAELNVKPRTTYLARIRNVNPELQDHE